MNKISAFVGHSFDHEDADVVRKFLGFLDTYKKSRTDFEWDHAEGAQPDQISKKVREKMKGKNLFIGICTQKERVICPKKLKQKWWKKIKLIGNEDNYSWKTSDWIVQELGYSLGLEMKSILLIEEGVRIPAGLQGDLEYVEFSRENPSASFEKIIQMLGYLTIRSVANNPQEEQKKTSETTEGLAPSNTRAEDFDYTAPNKDWSDLDYSWALFCSLKEKNTDAEKNIYESRMKLLDGDDQLEWTGEYLLRKQMFGDESAIEELKKIVEENPDNQKLHHTLGLAFKQYNDFGRAFDEFNKALFPRGTLCDIRYIDPTIETLVKYKGNDFARNYLRERVERVISSPEEQRTYLIAYADRCKEDSPNVYFALSEAALDINPGDANTRFNLAYKYSELGLHDHAVFHYQILTNISPSGANWNNLGVAYNDLNLPIKAIEAYKESEKLGETLSISNMANRLLTAGFVEDAEQLCKKALTNENYNKNIPSTMSLISEERENQENKVRAIPDTIKPDRQFLIDFANAFIKPSTLPTGKYKGIDGVLDIKASGEQFEALGDYSAEVSSAHTGSYSNTLAKYLMLQSMIEKIRYSGEIHGNAVIFKVTRYYSAPRGDAAMSSSPNIKDGLLYYDSSKDEFQVVEFSENTQNRAYTILPLKQ